MAYNKIIYGGTTLIDLTADTVTPDKLLTGITAHNMAGETIEGTCEFDSDTGDATAGVAEVLLGKTFYARGAKATGTMPNKGGVSQDLDTKTEVFTIPQGYHDGSGKVQIAKVEQDKIIAGNIKQGVTILGVTGNVEPSSSVTAQAKTVTPSTAKQTILPDSGVDYLSQVTVNAIPYTETANSAGGTTVTIAG